MKKIFYCIIVSALFLTILSGCDLLKQDTKDVSTSGNSQTQKEIQQQTPLNADALLDDQFYKTAISNKDSGTCDKILDTDKKTECKAVIESNTLTKTAVEKMDKTICDQITLERYRNNCLELISKKEAENQTQKEQMSFEQKALQQKDLSVCDGIEMENYKLLCKYNVAVQIAEETKNTSICEKIGNKDLTTQCNKSIIDK